MYNWKQIVVADMAANAALRQAEKMFRLYLQAGQNNAARSYLHSIISLKGAMANTSPFGRVEAENNCLATDYRLMLF